MAGSDVEGVALPVYRTMMAAARRFEAQSQEAGEAVSGTVTLRLRSPADFTAVTEIFAVHDYVPESLSWVNPVIVLSATKPSPPPWSATCASTASASRHRTPERVQPERI